jgi:hypothetical protein
MSNNLDQETASAAMKTDDLYEGSPVYFNHAPGGSERSSLMRNLARRGLLS